MTSVDVAEGRRLAEAANGDWYSLDYEAREQLGEWARNNLPALLTAHKAALERVRVETLEEAARIADQNSCIAAARIRALKDRRP